MSPNYLPIIGGAEQAEPHCHSPIGKLLMTVIGPRSEHMTQRDQSEPSLGFYAKAKRRVSSFYWVFGS